VAVALYGAWVGHSWAWVGSYGWCLADGLWEDLVEHGPSSCLRVASLADAQMRCAGAGSP
jgi:hypothetical protein